MLFRIVVYSVAVLLLIVGVLRWRRGRRLRRLEIELSCSRCDYPLAGKVGDRCSECGRTAKRRTSLLTQRRGRRFRRFGKILVLTSLALVLGSEWAAARNLIRVPTGVLIVSIGWAPTNVVLPALDGRRLSDAQWGQVFDRCLPLANDMGSGGDAESRKVDLFAGMAVFKAPGECLDRLRVALRGNDRLRAMRIIETMNLHLIDSGEWPVLASMLEPLTQHDDPETWIMARALLLSITTDFETHLPLMEAVLFHSEPRTRRTGIWCLTELRRRAIRAKGPYRASLFLAPEAREQVAGWLETLTGDSEPGVQRRALTEYSSSVASYGLTFDRLVLRLPSFLHDVYLRAEALEVAGRIAILDEKTCDVLAEIARSRDAHWDDALRLAACRCEEPAVLVELIEELLASEYEDERRFGRSLAISGNVPLHGELEESIDRSLAIDADAPDGVDVALHALIDSAQERTGVPAIVLAAQHRIPGRLRSSNPLIVRATQSGSDGGVRGVSSPLLHWAPVDDLAAPVLSAVVASMLEEGGRNGGRVTTGYGYDFGYGSGWAENVNGDVPLEVIWGRDLHESWGQFTINDLLFGDVLVRRPTGATDREITAEFVRRALRQPALTGKQDSLFTIRVLREAFMKRHYVCVASAIRMEELGPRSDLLPGTGYARSDDGWTPVRSVRSCDDLGNMAMLSDWAVRPAALPTSFAFVAWAIDPARLPLGWFIAQDVNGQTIRAESSVQGFTTLIVRDMQSGWLLTLHTNAASDGVLESMHDLADEAIEVLRETDPAFIRPVEMLRPELGLPDAEKGVLVDLLPWSVQTDRLGR